MGALGLGFLLAPATLISLDRATVDVALAALTIGILFYGDRDRSEASSPLVYLVLAAAPLARETGVLLIAAFALWSALAGRGRAVAWSALSALPFLAWWWYVDRHTTPDLTSHLSLTPFGGMAQRAMHPLVYPVTSAWLRKAAMFDYLAFLGVCVAFVLALMRPRSLAGMIALIFCAALVFVSQPQVWAETYAFGRIASPLLIGLALIALRERWWWGLAPVGMALPRVLWQLAPQLRGILRG